MFYCEKCNKELDINNSQYNQFKKYNLKVLCKECIDEESKLGVIDKKDYEFIINFNLK